MYELEPQPRGRSLILTLKGEVCLPDAVAFNNELRDYSKKPGLTHLILDLQFAEKMDNAALGALVSLNTSMNRYGRKLVLLHVTPQINELMKNASIEGFFPTCESLEELKGFIPETARK